MLSRIADNLYWMGIGYIQSAAIYDSVLTSTQLLAITEAMNGKMVLEAHYAIVVNDSIQLQTSDNTALTQHYVLTVNNATQLQTSENVILTQHYVLSVNNTIQLQNSDNIALTQHYILMVDNATQTQTSENILLPQHYSIVISNSSHTHITVEVPVLLTDYILTGQYFGKFGIPLDYFPYEAASNLTLVFYPGITGILVDNSTQLHTSDNVILTQHHMLVVSDCIHTQTADNVALTQHYVLTVDNSTQLQTSDNVMH